MCEEKRCFICGAVLRDLDIRHFGAACEDCFRLFRHPDDICPYCGGSEVTIAEGVIYCYGCGEEFHFRCERESPEQGHESDNSSFPLVAGRIFVQYPGAGPHDLSNV